MNAQDINWTERAAKTFKSHSWGYANTWGKTPKNLAYYQSTVKPYTGDLGKDYNCSIEPLASEFKYAWENGCRYCGRRVAKPSQLHFHIWFPDWIVVCRSCHPKLEGKTAKEWEAYKRQRFHSQGELRLF